VTQLVFGPPSAFPVMFRVKGADSLIVREIADQVEKVMRANPHMRQVNRDWTQRVPTVRYILDQDRLRLIGLSSTEAAQQLQFLLSGVSVTQVREDIRTVDVVARSSGPERLDPTRLADFSLTSADGRAIPLDQIGRAEVRMEEPLLRRRDRTPTITVRGDIDERLQPPDVSVEIQKTLAPVMAKLPAGYKIEAAGPIEESAKANAALALGPILFDNGDGRANRTTRTDWRGARAAVVPPALRLQRDPRPDRPRRHFDAQHADPDWADQKQ
jgi:multidrug efflux pump subunit AcrB